MAPCIKSFAERSVWSNVEFTKVVGRGALFTQICDDKLKSVPIALSVRAALPAVPLAGEREFSCGTGLFTIKLTTAVGFSPGFATATRKLPAAAIALAGMFA